MNKRKTPRWPGGGKFLQRKPTLFGSRHIDLVKTVAHQHAQLEHAWDRIAELEAKVLRQAKTLADREAMEEAYVRGQVSAALMEMADRFRTRATAWLTNNPESGYAQGRGRAYLAAASSLDSEALRGGQ